MPRPRGNARKKKARLTDSTLSTVMEVARPVSPPAEHTAIATVSEAHDPVAPSILDLLRTEPTAATMPAAYNDAGRVFTGASWFPAEHFVLGVVVCEECGNEMIYYQDRETLATGYRFRCRICQHELLATAPSGASD